MEFEWLLLAAGTLIGGGGITAFLRARAEAPLVAAKTQDIIINNLQDENRRLRERLRELEARIVALEGDME